jgi:predicted RNA-binding protein YlxR (DUF448 family)
MLRIAVVDNTLTLDERGRLPGRGAYLHYRNRCITNFGRTKAGELRSLKRRVSREERCELIKLIHTRLDSSGTLE